jgi:3-oxoacyl-[acyl-carrier protein] reductase
VSIHGPPAHAYVVSAIAAGGREAIAVGADVSKPEDVRRLFAQTIQAFGRLDILVNNAGVYRFEPFEAVTIAEFRRVYETNVLGPIQTMQEAIKHFDTAGGVIVNIATAGISSTTPMSSTYTSSKAALVALSRVLANPGSSCAGRAPSSSCQVAHRAYRY